MYAYVGKREIECGGDRIHCVLFIMSMGKLKCLAALHNAIFFSLLFVTFF